MQRLPIERLFGVGESMADAKARADLDQQTKAVQAKDFEGKIRDTNLREKGSGWVDQNIYRNSQ